MESFSQESDCLLPMRFVCCSSSIADHRVFVETLRLMFPEGTQVFGFKVYVPHSTEYSDFQCDYEGLLWPSFDKESNCDVEKWRELADAKAVLEENGILCDVGFWRVPAGSEGLSMAQVGREVLSYLMAQERVAREKEYVTRWFGEFPHAEMFCI